VDLLDQLTLPQKPAERSPRLCPPACAVPGGARKTFSPAAGRAALLWTETPDLMEISAPPLERGAGIYHLGVTAL